MTVMKCHVAERSDSVERDIDKVAVKTRQQGMCTIGRSIIIIIIIDIFKVA